MDIQEITEAIIFNAREIAQEIDDCEWVQSDECKDSRYSKDMAKQTTYDHICDLIFGRRE